MHTPAAHIQKRVRGTGAQMRQSHFLLLCTYRLHSFTEPVLAAHLHVLWLNISAIEAPVFMETANYNANVAKVLREIKI